MTIEFSKSGGFAGIVRPPFRVDLADLPPKEAERVKGMVENAHFWTLRPRAAGPGADRFQYAITVESDGRKNSLRVSDGAIPEELEPLVEYLVEAARREVQEKSP